MSTTNANSVVSSGASVVVDSDAYLISPTVMNGGTLTVAGAIVSGQVYGAENVISGGIAIGSTIDGGQEVVSSGGRSLDTIVLAGTQSVEGGVVSGATVMGADYYSTIGSDTYGNALQTITSGGVAIATTLSTGVATNAQGLVSYHTAAQVVGTGGVAIDTVLNGDLSPRFQLMNTWWVTGLATETVLSGGTAIRTVANVGGAIDVQAGGTASDASLGGGSLTLEIDATYKGTLTFQPVAEPPNGGQTGPYTSGSTLTATISQLSAMTIVGFNVTGSVYYAYQTLKPLAGDTINRIIVSDLTFAGSYGEIDRGEIGPDGTLTVIEGDTSATLHLSGAFGSEFYFQRAPDGGTEITYGVPCYCPGTLITTPDGDRPVERLAIGDLVLTASGAPRPIRWIGRRSYEGRFAAGNPDIMPVVIRAGALGDDLPRRDLTVSPLHAMAVDGWLVPARLLLNGRSIAQQSRLARVDYIHIELETHDLLLAEGAPSETFIDDGSRAMFHNAVEFAQLYPPVKGETAETRFCLPRIEDGPALEAIRARLSLIAAKQTDRRAVAGYVDVAAGGVIAGWARSQRLPGTPVELVVRRGSIEVGRIVADRRRADLDGSPRYSGAYGFEFRPDEKIDIAGLTVHEALSDVRLRPSGARERRAAV
ncbi:Hint domain-containing protein [Acetobacter sp. DsW_063]|uniref:Hint domain-containing protein n=1 Tax=Acetobacter sp. DsW_063 TaxID=1514894 RepID=UPI001302B92A|nr:Hint domain-containing protein [Acetobacter sp. DsW_063]